MYAVKEYRSTGPANKNNINIYFADRQGKIHINREAHKHTGINQLTISTATSKISLKRTQLLLYSDFVFKDLAKPKEWPEKGGGGEPLQPISLKFFYFSNALSNLPAELFSSSWCG